MTPIPPSFLMAGFFYLCYTGSVHKIGEEVKLLKDYDWWVKAWNAYNNPPTKTIPLDASDALQGKITSVVVLVIAIFAIPLIIRRAIADAKEDMMGENRTRRRSNRFGLSVRYVCLDGLRRFCHGTNPRSQNQCHPPARFRRPIGKRLQSVKSIL